MEKHLDLWEVQPRDPDHGLRVLVRVNDPISSGKDYGIVVYVFLREGDAREFASSRPKHWTVEKRRWAQSIYERCRKSGSLISPRPIEF